jgi:antitoxin (DNA-binding transcriptional repressor) of toxin-antitoxin stability system
VVWVTTIQQKQLRNEVGDVLRRAEAGEEFTVTVAGRPVAPIGARRRNTWVPVAQLHDLLKLPSDPTLASDLQGFQAGLSDPWNE